MRSLAFSLTVLVLALVRAMEEIPNPTRSDDTDYCKDEYKCNGTKHYACEHKEQSEGTWQNPYPNCESIECHKLEAAVSSVQRGILLEKVNNFRNKVADGKAGFKPGGSNVRQLSWDYKLERFAKIYGTNNPYNVDLGDKPWIKMCAKTKELNRTEGLYCLAGWDVNSTPEISSALSLWTAFRPSRSDIANFSRPGPGKQPPPCPGPGQTPKPSPATRFGSKYSWTMLAWASATKMGCAFAKKECLILPSMSDIENIMAVLICFIGGDVNTEGQAVFKQGEACSACPNGTMCKPMSYWPKLCATPDDPVLPYIVTNPDMTTSVHHGTIIPLLISVVFVNDINEWVQFLTIV